MPWHQSNNFYLYFLVELNKMIELDETYVNLDLVDKLLALFRQPTFDNLTSILIYTLQFLGTLKGIPGTTKKKMAINSIIRFVDATDMTGDLEPVVLRVLPTMIDNLISVDNQKLVINPKAKNIFGKAVSVVKSIPFMCCKK